MGRLPDVQNAAATPASASRENSANSSSANSTSKAPFPDPPPCFGLGQLTRHNAMQLKQLNLATLPVTYGDTLYEQLQRHSEFSRLGYLGEVMVGAICCRVEAPAAPAPGAAKKKHRLYIMTLSVLKPYRRYGVASGLLSYVLSRASQPQTGVELEDCYLHVWTENKYALAFYEKRGFVNEGIQEDYYTDVTPTSAYILRAPLPWVYADPKLASRDADDYDVTQHNLVAAVSPPGSK
ncbi:acetyltransferase, GNAT family protein [Toxoplasma gondii TgCatPRC2]|uniref:Acetyltransferase domain-containing protein n=10 Tax=Toxoplasma gondii TaxID=5811 RepID=B9PKR9_TOXGV|nr:acetyltransferase, GNAT family protein [Toxoplasma gondii GT1]ESS32023.1 acetyltransferase, GNAT family protein [Toxoplasma gondii VEG]KAF4641215.1 acetyltransferase, GNAT family protein [Toxoplasma gondii]KFG34103.1 acetyltransferase, GNAT family protein [Toxoplasma gondii GAB2-2007-GAL-DOM2]KFG40187.1 acetyltransferase, GNAT family protein [Toxoplasma gondii p89]KFG40587.1 acetyltransferase, GNAT family protein [Toxoplasma gondii FOU]KYK70392.1 acetyltransferase, GNAT family protein [Tox